MTYLEGPRPRLFAHRGASGTAPENTIEAFLEGIAAGADRLELDVHASADGHLVVFHDETLVRTTGASGFLRERTLAELKKLDAGYHFEIEPGRYPYRGKGVRIPTLAEVLEAFPDVSLNVEVKYDDGTTVEAFYDVLDRHGARDRVLAAAFEDPIVKRLRAVAPETVTSLSAEEVAEFFGRCISDSLHDYVPPGKALQVPPSHENIEIVTPQFVKAAHDLDMEVHVWTINDEAEMDRLLDLGIDGLMSDFPALARAVFERRGLR
ncbi:MAG: glycerophosphodiester phosphodiesterase [Candidatus Binatia bacterium]